MNSRNIRVGESEVCLEGRVKECLRKRQNCKYNFHYLLLLQWSRWAKVSLQLLLGGVLPLWHLINLLFNMLTTQGTTALSLALPSLTHPSATLTAPRINRWHWLTIATMITNWLSGVLLVTFCKSSNGCTSVQDLIKFYQKQMFNVNLLSVTT